MPKISGEIFPDGDFYPYKGRIRHDRAKQHFPELQSPKYRRHHRYLLDQKMTIDPPSALIAWQGGMEGGLATAELGAKDIPVRQASDTFAAPWTTILPPRLPMNRLTMDYTEDIWAWATAILRLLGMRQNAYASV